MKCRTVLAVLAIALVPILAGAQEENQGYDKTDPILLTVDQEYSGTTHSDRERKYFVAQVESGAEYRLDMTGLSVDLDIYYLGSDDTFLRGLPRPVEPMPRTTTSGSSSRRRKMRPTSSCTITTTRNRNSSSS